MEKVALLVFLLALLANGEVSFHTNMYRDRVSMTCSGKGLSSNYLNYVSTVITRSAGENVTYVASKSSRRTASNFTGASTGYYYGDYSTNNSLTLSWYYPYSFDDGTYTCTLYYLDQDSFPRSETKQITVKYQDLDPVIDATPKNIVDGLTKSLVVECFSISLAIHDLSLPAKLELFHSYDGTQQRIASAEADDSDNIESVAESGWKIVSSNIADDQTLTLAVIRELPTTRESGTYKCILSGTNNETGTVAQIVKTVQVTASVATKQDVYDRVGEEDLTEYLVSVCNFENGVCGFDTSTSNSDPGWKHWPSRLVGDIPERTSGSGLGHYLRADIAAEDNSVATVRSKVFQPTKRRVCVSLWHYVSGYNAELSVYIRQNATSSPASVTRSSTYGWNYLQLSVAENSGPFTVELQFRNYYAYYYYSYYAGYAVIDDFVVQDISCNSYYF